MRTYEGVIAYAEEYNLEQTLVNQSLLISESRDEADLDKRLKTLQKLFDFDFKNIFLLTAAQEANAFLVGYLLKNEADANTVDPCGYTPLHYVGGMSDQDNKTVVELLLAKGADVNFVGGRYKDTPLTAIMGNMITRIEEFSGSSLKNQGAIDILELLLNAGADPSVKNSFGRNVLDYAALKGAEDIKELVNRYTDSNSAYASRGASLFGLRAQLREETGTASPSAAFNL